MHTINLDLLDAHPDNANVMPDALLDKLINHIRETGNCPPLIVRPHPTAHGRYQLLDGHHRAEALRQLGWSEALCDVWDVDDEQASMLLLTLNRLHGEDDPHRRGELLARLRSSMSVEQLAAKLPDDAKQITRLIGLTQPPPQPAPPRDVEDMPHAVTFFVTAAQRKALLAKLREIDSDRTSALLQVLKLK